MKIIHTHPAQSPDRNNQLRTLHADCLRVLQQHRLQAPAAPRGAVHGGEPLR